MRWRVGPVWYGVALLGPVLLYLAALALEVVLGGQPPRLGALAGALPTVLVYAANMVVFVAIGEEVGWRGERRDQAPRCRRATAPSRPA